MKKINDELKQLTHEQIEELSNLLNIEGTGTDRSSNIVNILLTYTGIHFVLSGLSKEELMVLDLVYKEKDGITYGDIEKQLKIDITQIENISKVFSKRMLIYVLKNRQRLHNKMDKIYLFPEIREILDPVKENTIKDHFEKALSQLNQNKSSSDIFSLIKHNAASQKFVDSIFERGGVATFDEASRMLSKDQLEQKLKELRGKKILCIYHDFRYPFRSLIFLNSALFPALIDRIHTPALTLSMNIHNNYYFLLNMLNTYDIISTNGLFLTKQKEFRKIDLKRLLDSMLTIYDLNGVEIEPDKILGLCLYHFNQLKCITLKKDAAVISLKNIEKDIDTPLRLLSRIIKLPHANSAENTLFPNPYELPTFGTVSLLLDIISNAQETTSNYLYISFIISSLAQFERDRLPSLTELRGKAITQFTEGMRFLCICGVIEVQNGKIKLSEIGNDFISKQVKVKKTIQDKPDKNTKKIYINPDFTIIIPKNEIPSEACYHLISHTDIIKDDVILHTRISKSSIVRASKRGMKHDEFISTLEQYSRNEIPQNLKFLLNEWAQQTIRLNIREVTLLYTTHPSLIDELGYEESKSGIIEKISQNYAIIDRHHLDYIIKLAQKKDAVINLFEDYDDDASS